MLYGYFLLQAVSADTIFSLVGVSAAVLTTSSFLPQIVRANKAKNMSQVSPYLMSMFATGTVLWMIYGFYRSDPVIVGANAVATAFNAVLLYMKSMYSKAQKKIV